MFERGARVILNPISYVKSRGVRRFLQVFWRYKLPKLQIAILACLTKPFPLMNKIVIESHNDFDCNGGAFYNWLVSNGYNKKIKIVWRLYHDAPVDLPDNVSCVPVYGPSWRKAWAICTAKWLTADCTVADKVRDDQLSVYMTHGGFGLKNCHGLITVPESVDYILSPSPSFDDWTRWMYEADNSSVELIHVGYPSLDRLYDENHEAVNKPNWGDGKTILWMPTFRQGVAVDRNDSSGDYPYGVPLVRDRRALEKLAGVLRQYNVRLVIKLHPKQDLSSITSDMPEGIEFITGDSIKLQKFDNYDLMLEADAMIGDFSGAIYEYLVLNRPIAFVLSDLSEYKIGLIDNAEKYMVGPKIYNFDDLETFIRDVSNGTDSFSLEREELLRRMYDLSDGCSSERLSGILGISK